MPALYPIVLSGPTEEPVPLDGPGGLKEWLRMDEIEVEDELIRLTGKAAREWFEIACDRSFTFATWELRLPAFGAFIEVPFPPTQQLLKVEYRDPDDVLQLLDPSVYQLVQGVTPARIILRDGETWPSTSVNAESVVVTFRAGGDVPEMAKTGIKMLTAFWTTYRGDPVNPLGRVGSPMATLPIPPQVMHLSWALASYRF